MTILNKQDYSNIIILIGAAVLMILLYGKINHEIEPFSKWDLTVYRDMAAVAPDINPDAPSPFAYRLLGPCLAGILPLSNTLSFYLFAVVFSCCLTIQFYCLLRFLSISAKVSIVTVLLYMFNKHLFGFTIWNYFQLNDLLSLNFLIILFMSMWKDRWGAFCIILIFGALTREASMLAVPTLLLYLLEHKRDNVNWVKVSLAIIPGIVVFVLIRLLIPSTSEQTLWLAFVTHSTKIYSLESNLRLINAFLPLSFVPLIFWKTTLRFFASQKYLLLYFGLVCLSTMFGSNIERLMAPAFIAFYILIARILEEVEQQVSFSFVIICGLLSSFHHLYGKWPMPDVYWTYLFTFGSTILITAHLYFMKVRLQTKECSLY